MSTLKTNNINIDKSNEITKENKRKNINDIQDINDINDMDPLDLMNQVITTNSNASNETQQQLLNNNFSNTINNNIKGDSELLEYSKSFATNLTNLNNNTDENTLPNNINNSNKNNKKISYHCGKYIHKNKGVNLNNNFNYSNENGDENINEDESIENDENINKNNNGNNNKEKEDKINLIKSNNLKNNNVLSPHESIKYNPILTDKNKNSNYNQNQTNPNQNNEENYSMKNLYTPNNNKIFNLYSPFPMAFNNSSHISNNNSNINYYSANKENNNPHIIGNSQSNTTNTSSMKKYEKKLSILKELENSKFNNSPYNINSIVNQKTNSINPIRTNTSNELLTNDNELSLKIGSPQNIPNNLSSKLHDWLISCDLLCYYNLLIKNKIYNIDEYIDKIKKNQISITYKNIEDLGIKKPGHIFRFLLRLKIDTKIIDPFIYNVILDKYNRNSLNDIKLNSSNNIFNCCCFRENTLKIDKKSISNNNSAYNDTYLADNSNDIFAFLKKLNLLWLKENFIHNGFDQVEFIMIQMFSDYIFNKEILNEYLHIYNDEDKKKVLKKLFEEKKNICNEYNLDYDINEENQILTPRTNEEATQSHKGCILF